MPADQHATDQPGHDGAVAHHQPDDHGGDHGHDDHTHADDDALGPIDLAAWGAGILGVVVALVIAVCFAVSTSAI
jgi:hypothetical protein